jgi:hypothetical protein
LQVPLTTKSSHFIGAPIKSILVKKGSPFSNPTTIGSQNQGPNLIKSKLK